MKWQKNYKMMWTALALSASLIATACSKGGGGGGTATTPVGQFGACGGCTFSQGVMMTATTQYPGMTFTMRLIGDSNQMAAQATTSTGRYTGPIMVDGTLVVAAQKTATNCVIPAGTYTISTVQPGQVVGYGDFSIPQFQAVGPTSLLFRLSQAFPNSTYFGGVGRIAGQLEILQGPMGYGTTYPTYPNPTTPTIGAIGACNDYWGFYLN